MQRVFKIPRDQRDRFNESAKKFAHLPRVIVQINGDDVGEVWQITLNGTEPDLNECIEILIEDDYDI